MIDSKKSPAQILLLGPEVATSDQVYGGGIGGYVRGFKNYLGELQTPDLKLQPVYQTTRGNSTRSDSFILRFLYDTTELIRAIKKYKPDAVHLFAQYRKALPREVAVAALCRLSGIPFIYDIKAGAFEAEYKKRSPVYRFLVRYVLRTARSIFVQGRAPQRFLLKELHFSSVYFPNFVPANEIPEVGNELMCAQEIRLLFVGYCYPGKGVIELLNGCREAAKQGLRLRLEIVGAEDEEFSRWANELKPVDNLTVIRHGRLAHDQVLEKFREVDVYAYPTTHPGEGHNNSINEAMMHGLVIITTRHGFLEEVLEPDCAVFLESNAAHDISEALNWIDENRKEAALIGASGREKLLNAFTSEIAKERFYGVYSALLRKQL